MQSLVCGIIVLCVAAGAALGAHPSDEFFGDNMKVYTAHIRVTAVAWELMQPQRRARAAAVIANDIPAPTKVIPNTSQEVPKEARRLAVEGDRLPPNNFGYEYVYVKSQFECDGVKLKDVGLRFKGNASYDNLQRSYKRPYKLDFNRFTKGQEFKGLKSINLSNNAFDSTQLREALSYYCYRQARVPAPRTAFANVYLTIEGVCEREFLGLFTFIEEMDESLFLENHFKSAKGLIMKPEGMRGLPYLGEQFEPYQERYRAKSGEDANTYRRFIEFTKVLNYADDETFGRKIGEYLDVEGFLRYLAVSVLITNLDSLLVTNHNFYIHTSDVDGKVRILPWDMNLSFAAYGTPGPPDHQVRLSIFKPWAGENKIFTRLMAMPEVEKRYREIIKEYLASFFNEKSMNAVIDRMSVAVAEAGKIWATQNGRMDDTANQRFGAMRTTLKQYVPLRVESVEAQLAGQTENLFYPRANPPNMNFRWGLAAPQQFGNVTMMAKSIRQSADKSGDYRLDSRELRDVVALLFYNLADESNPESLSLVELSQGIDPLSREHGGQGARGGFLNKQDRGSGMLWARVVFLDADSDRDGQLTLAELTNFVDRWFCLADTDQSGKVEERELCEALDALASPR